MPAVARTISITEHHDAFLSDQIAQGRHASTSEVVREALRRYEDDVRREEAHLAYLKRLGDEGEVAIDKGDYIDVPHDQLGSFLDSLGREARSE
ncbi:type II toxin-antitoxin system ParD family antitoxin [Acidisoma silvae]|uniref:Type II toxin-antitoxin system ParD family antitoxin n=1 Tax=Acidisoma silvae TaxID=2802396 RepID=A0A963YY72_9PROT|nr:type II toxin-antitoxin system ParD family antitoxin [Acidisoma silvae]MCB8878487.1 type II toxin-antitoxin system ParD family antitoxin [Acidisoma silvae]